MSGTRVIAAIAAGGSLGAALRYGIGALWPEPLWATLLTNLAGCALIGVLMVLTVEVGVGHPLLRPFLGVGLLGGFTTFSGYAVGAVAEADAGRYGVALAYLLVTVVGAVAATWAGAVGTRWLTRRFG